MLLFFGKRGVFAKKKNRCLPPLCPAIERVPGETRAVLKKLESAEFVGAGFPANEKVRQGKDNKLSTKKGGNYFGKKEMKKVKCFASSNQKKRALGPSGASLFHQKHPKTRMVRNNKVVPFLCLYARVPFRLPVQPLQRPRSSALDPKASSIGLRPPRLPRWTDAATATSLTSPP